MELCVDGGVAMKRGGTLKRSALARRTPLRAVNGPKPRRVISPASEEQRAKVAGRRCVNCGVGPGCDPAHLTSRSMGGCDHPDCVLPLCRSCHRDFDDGRIDLEPVLALAQFAAERAHMASHLTLRQCMRRLNGRAA